MSKASDRLVKARVALIRAAILYVIDSMHAGADLHHAVTSAAGEAGVSVDWLAARVAIFRTGRERPVIMAALKAAGLLPVAQ